MSVATLSMACTAQAIKEGRVPPVVTEAFKKAYGDAREVKWEKEGAGFEAGFEVGGASLSVAYDASGHLIEAETRLSVEELPASIKTCIANNYNGAKIKGAVKITGAKGIVSSEAEIKGRDLIFGSSGTCIKEEVDKSGGLE